MALRCVSVIRKAQISPSVWIFLRFTTENQKNKEDSRNPGSKFLILYFLYIFLLYYGAVSIYRGCNGRDRTGRTDGQFSPAWSTIANAQAPFAKSAAVNSRTCHFAWQLEGNRAKKGNKKK